MCGSMRPTYFAKSSRKDAARSRCRRLTVRASWLLIDSHDARHAANHPITREPLGGPLLGGCRELLAGRPLFEAIAQALLTMRQQVLRKRHGTNVAVRHTADGHADGTIAKGEIQQ